MLTLILMVFAFVLLVVAGFVAPGPELWWKRLLCFGLSCWVLADILTRGPALLHG